MRHYFKKLNEFSCEIPFSIVSPVTLRYWFHWKVSFHELSTQWRYPHFSHPADVARSINCVWHYSRKALGFIAKLVSTHEHPTSRQKAKHLMWQVLNVPSHWTVVAGQIRPRIEHQWQFLGNSTWHVGFLVPPYKALYFSASMPLITSTTFFLTTTNPRSMLVSRSELARVLERCWWSPSLPNRVT